MQFDVEKLLVADPATLRAWHAYRDESGDEPAFEIELRCATGDEQEAFIRKCGKKDPKPSDWRAFWLAHVLDWRGLRNGTTEIAYTPELAEALWHRDAEFRAWVVTTSQKLDNFR